MKRSQLADRWFEKSEDDLTAARIMRREGLHAHCAYQCQQAVEKSIKALWIDVKQADPPRIHGVGPIAVQLGADADLVRDINDVVGEYMASRYPDAASALPANYYTDTDSEQRLTKTEHILSWVAGHWEAEDE
jgi:HEPN domain-containing protein